MPDKSSSDDSVTPPTGPTADSPDIAEPKELEDIIVELALSGELAKAAQAAIENHRRHGVPITSLRGEEIVTESPDGTIEVIGRVERPTYTLPAGVNVFPQRS